MHEAEFARVDYDVRDRSKYINSPANKIHDGAAEVCARSSNVIPRRVASTLPMMLTDYVAWPLYHTLGKRHTVAFETERLRASMTPIASPFSRRRRSLDFKPKPAAQIARLRAASPSPPPPLGGAARRSFPAG